jgi:hypothetical protein
MSPPEANDTWFFAWRQHHGARVQPCPRAPAELRDVGERAAPEYFPAMIDGGTGGDKSDEGAAHIDDWLARNPDIHFWAIMYGTNDAAGNSSQTTRFRTNMQTIVDRVRGRRSRPILATIPSPRTASIETFQTSIVCSTSFGAANSLAAGPDLYTWFAGHPDELRDGVHPNDRGGRLDEPPVGRGRRRALPALNRSRGWLPHTWDAAPRTECRRHELPGIPRTEGARGHDNRQVHDHVHDHPRPSQARGERSTTTTSRQAARLFATIRTMGRSKASRPTTAIIATAAKTWVPSAASAHPAPPPPSPKRVIERRMSSTLRRILTTRPRRRSA